MLLIIALLATTALRRSASALSPILLSQSPPSYAPPPMLESFVSFAIEFASFPDFAGNQSKPNTFSYHLLTNVGRLQGSNPVIRVGGNTQDYALLNSSQSTALIGKFDNARSMDYPTTVTIGPSFFDSYLTWPNMTFIHGFNLAQNGTVGMESLLGCAALACKALTGGKLADWELGNEPDLYKTLAQGVVRPSWWTEQDYVNEWLNKSREIKTVMQKSCPVMVQDGMFKFIAPGFGGTTNSLKPVSTWYSGLEADKDIAMVSGHIYMAGANQSGITLRETLLNHSMTVASISDQLQSWNQLASTGLPFIYGEANNLYDEGKPGLSNTFGAALWAVDFNLYCASQGVRRVHMQQGTNSRYNAWQPIQTSRATIGTKAPYYASIAVANFLGDLTKHNVTVVNVELAGIYEAAYAAYVDGQLARIAVIQMDEYNYTSTASNGDRPMQTYAFQLPLGTAGKAMKIQRLMANGSDAISGVSFGGYSYNYELDGGRPVMLKNITMGEAAMVAQGGLLQVDVPWSSAVILSFI